ncbi:nucleoside triphosphate pyrophosphohydrolase [Veillonella criceti]|uniref:Nucleoside triphosphate pyrophosphohydrolase/pyrophosphatase MazG n=1 Tax=Veillonella criceti TaxID=103891 RepID=A0A380NKK0_9FIRM|nr:nucleoside triphosphate pyrophosphohydrolase [Veillonella criceti]SUP42006.1 Nucleoside triphosphate pyrophosphohydrolase/pyrophosphatase MazG [Veillonella criceti]
MSLAEISHVIEQLGIESKAGVFLIESSQLEYVPFDLAGALVITGIKKDKTSLERILEGLNLRFEAHTSFQLVGIRETNQLIGPKHIKLCQLLSIGRTYLAEESEKGDTAVRWLLIKGATDVVEASNHHDVSNFTLQPLIDVVAALRAPNGCPWDRLQTHSTLRRYLLEEVYEVLEAIDNKDIVNLREELGDVLLQIVFHARLAEEQGLFSVQDIIDDISAKMIRRHPHVFTQANAQEVATTQLNWEALKAQEPGHQQKTVLAGVSKGLPALLGAQKLQEKAAKVGFDWDSEPPVWAKFEEEIAEFKEAIAQGDYENAELEGGDVLFSLINLLRWYKIGGENALNRTNNKFRRRFAYVERCVKDSGRSWADFSLDELDSFWDSAKVSEQKHSLK